MNVADLRQFIDLGGVFILAMVLLQQWSSRFDHIEEKLTRVIALLCLTISKDVPAKKIENILNEKELEVVKKIK